MSEENSKWEEAANSVWVDFAPVSAFGFCYVPTENYVAFGSELNDRGVGYEVVGEQRTISNVLYTGVVFNPAYKVQDLVAKNGGFFVDASLQPLTPPATQEES